MSQKLTPAKRAAIARQVRAQRVSDGEACPGPDAMKKYSELKKPVFVRGLEEQVPRTARPPLRAFLSVTKKGEGFESLPTPLTAATLKKY